MKHKLFYWVKYIPWLYCIYFYLGSLAIFLLKIFVRPNDKLILFISFGGRRFDDSPKAIYQQMILDPRFDSYRIVWAFKDPESFNLVRGEKVRCDTLLYFITALKARIWISNSTVERGLEFKGKHTFYFNTWHGTPIKKMGSDVEGHNKGFKGKGQWKVDYFTCQGKYEQDIFCRVFNGLNTENTHLIGLPRNDIYANYSKEYMRSLRKKLGIPMDKRVILYAPTFREYDKSSNYEIKTTIPIDIQNLKQELGDKYIFLFRAHYEVSRRWDIKGDDFIYEMSNYPSLEDLMIVSDILISDYSSIFFDYSIMDKSMLAYCYDYDLYSVERGMYFDIRDWLPSAAHQEELLDLIRTEKYDEQIAMTKRFRERFVTSYGSAVKQSLNVIYNELNRFPEADIKSSSGN